MSAVAHRREDPEQRQPVAATSACSARSRPGSRSSSTGGSRWARSAGRSATSTCAPRCRSRPTAGRTSTTSRCRTTAGASSSSPSRTAATHGFGDFLGQPVWDEVPGEFRNLLRRLVVTQGDTEPASVEQQRLLGATAPSLYDLRNLFQVNVEEGRHLWAMVYLLHTYFGRDGREEAEELLAAALGRRRQAAHPRRVQRADLALAVVLHVHDVHRPRRQVPAARARRERLRSARAHLPVHADRGGAPHVRRRDRRAARRQARLRADEAGRERRPARARAASTCRRSRST